VQVPLQMSTAACARQGRMGRDQVRDLSFGGNMILFLVAVTRIMNRSISVVYSL
jgi:hypothetical protein